MKSIELRTLAMDKFAEANKIEDNAASMALMDEATELLQRADKASELEAAQSALSEVRNARQLADVSAEAREASDPSEVRDFGNFIKSKGEARGQTIKVADEGGVSVPTEISSKLITTLVDYGPMLDSRFFSVAYPTTGRDLKYIRAKGNRKARVVDEAASAAELTNKLDSVTLKTFTMTTDISFTTNELLQDSAISVAQWIGEDQYKSYGLGANEYATIGNGTTQPMGICTALESKAKAFTGFVDADAPTNAEIAELVKSLLRMQYDVNGVYRRNGRYMINSKVEMYLREYRDENGRPVWQDSIKDDAPAKIHGKEILINDDMPDIGEAGKVFAVFGDGSNFQVNVAAGLAVTKLSETYATKNAIGWLGYGRMASNVVNADAFSALKSA